MRIKKQYHGKTIGLTGGIAAGKSTAARIMEELGAERLDLDLLGHRCYEPGSGAHASLIAMFGESVRAENGAIDRRALGSIVFGDAKAMKKLTELVWPLIGNFAREEIQAIRKRRPEALIVVEGALIVEARWAGIFDEIWVMLAEPAEAAARLMARNGFSEEQAKARLAAQMPARERTKGGYRLIFNNGSLEDLKRAVLDVVAE